VDSDVGTVTYTTGKMELVGFYPIAIGSVSTGNTTPLEVSVVPLLLMYYLCVNKLY